MKKNNLLLIFLLLTLVFAFTTGCKKKDANQSIDVAIGEHIGWLTITDMNTNKTTGVEDAVILVSKISDTEFTISSKPSTNYFKNTTYYFEGGGDGPDLIKGKPSKNATGDFSFYVSSKVTMFNIVSVNPLIKISFSGKKM